MISQMALGNSSHVPNHYYIPSMRVDIPHDKTKGNRATSVEVVLWSFENAYPEYAVHLFAHAGIVGLCFDISDPSSLDDVFHKVRTLSYHYFSF